MSRLFQTKICVFYKKKHEFSRALILFDSLECVNFSFVNIRHERHIFRNLGAKQRFWTISFGNFVSLC